MILLSFSSNMKILRKKRKLSQDDLSRISGVSQSSISAIELETRSPTEETMKMIAKALRVPLSDMLSDEKDFAAKGSEAEREDLINLLVSLNPDEAQRVRDFVSGLLASQAKDPAAPAKDA